MKKSGTEGPGWPGHAATAMVVLFPAVVAPGLDEPFSTPKITLLACFVVIVGILATVTGRLSRPALPPLLFLPLGFWVSALLVSCLRGEFVSPYAVSLFLLCVAWFFLALALRPNLIHLATGISVSCAIVAAVALLQYLGLDPFRLLGWTTPHYGSPRMRVFSTLGNPDYVAAFLVCGLPLTAAVGKVLKRRLLFSLLIGLELAALFATGSRSPVVAVTAILLWFLILGKFTDWRPMALSAAIIIALVPLMPSRPIVKTLEGRLYIWRVVSPHLLERPLFGSGPGAFEPKYIEWETGYWRSGKGSEQDRVFAEIQTHAHNDYLETMVNGGLTGLLGLVSVLAAVVSSAFRRFGRSRSDLVAGASAGVVALAAVAIVDFPFHRPAELFMFFTLIAVLCLERAAPAAVTGAG